MQSAALLSRGVLMVLNCFLCRFRYMKQRSWEDYRFLMFYFIIHNRPTSISVIGKGTLLWKWSCLTFWESHLLFSPKRKNSPVHVYKGQRAKSKAKKRLIPTMRFRILLLALVLSGRDAALCNLGVSSLCSSFECAGTLPKMKLMTLDATISLDDSALQYEGIGIHRVHCEWWIINAWLQVNSSSAQRWGREAMG